MPRIRPSVHLGSRGHVRPIRPIIRDTPLTPLTRSCVCSACLEISTKAQLPSYIIDYFVKFFAQTLGPFSQRASVAALGDDVATLAAGVPVADQKHVDAVEVVRREGVQTYRLQIVELAR